MAKGCAPGGGRKFIIALILSLLAGLSITTGATAQERYGYESSNRLLQQYLQQRSAIPGETIQPEQTLIPPLNQVRPGAQVPGYAPGLTPVSQAPLGVGGAIYGPRRPEPLSPLERAYASRLEKEAPRFVSVPLRQFGYNQIRNLSTSNQQLISGAVSGNYRLGIGDELVVTFRGQVNRSYRTVVDREGQVVLPKMAPIPAAGRTFAAFERALERRTASTFLKSDVFVSLGRVRSMPIAVLGQVRNPGVQRLTGLANVFDALAAAGGIEKTGSLRRVEIIRGRKIIPVDLYQLFLTGGLGGNYVLQEGDRVFVPPIGPTFAVVGAVQRPGIYELLPGQSKTSVAQALALAGGTLKPSGYLYLTLTPRPGGNDLVRQAVNPKMAALGAGDILAAAPKSYAWTDAFFLDGDVTAPGPRSLANEPTVAAALANPHVLGRDPYLLFAVVRTTDPHTLAPEFIPIDLQKVRGGKTNYRLASHDRLIILSLSDVEYLASAPVQDILAGHSVPEEANCRGLARLAAIVSRSRSHRFDRAVVAVNPTMTHLVPPATSRRLLTYPSTAEREKAFSGLGSQAVGPEEPGQIAASPPSSQYFSPESRGLNGPTGPTSPTGLNAAPPVLGFSCPAVFNRYPALMPFILQSVVILRGEIQRPGIYPILPQTSLASLVRVGGGFMDDADPREIHVTHFEAGSKANDTNAERTIDADRVSLVRVALVPGDAVQFDQRFTNSGNGTVYLAGQFRVPGIYPITRGEHLSQVIAQAGGLTPEAYPIGAVFTRASVAHAQRTAFLREARQLQSSLATSLASLTSKQASEGKTLVTAVEHVVRELRTTKPTGRVVVQADPAVLTVKPELDTLLEPGDAIYMPKRPSYVTVSGEVLNPSTVPYRPDATVDEYVKAAGGVTEAADQDRTFVVFPNGEAQPADISFWNFTPMHIPPGSTVIVPRNPEPFDLLKASGSIASILGNLALTAASIAVVSRYP